MQKFCTLTLIAALSFTAACSTKSEKILAPESEATNITLRSGQSRDAILGFRATEVVVTSNKEELEAVPCRIDGTEFFAEFTAPATVNLPSYGPDSKSIRLSCEVEGQKAEKVIAAENLSAAARQGNSVATAVLLSPIVGVAMAASAGKHKDGDAYGYKDIKLEL
ncbi:hypothetical protein [Candidatus Rhodobacter oscarellae]|nr:hypothetical protein [Candidatus Rhodobacter lobularis]